jgi:hypothetical protein
LCVSSTCASGFARRAQEDQREAAGRDVDAALLHQAELVAVEVE